jgi:hypothetical protein
MGARFDDPAGLTGNQGADRGNDADPVKTGEAQGKAARRRHVRSHCSETFVNSMRIIAQLSQQWFIRMNLTGDWHLHATKHIPKSSPARTHALFSAPYKETIFHIMLIGFRISQLFFILINFSE